MATVIVGGVIANRLFNGGAAWTRLNYVLGLQKLGFDVYFVEQINPDAVTLAYFNRVMKEFGLTGKSALLHSRDSTSCTGMSYTALMEVADSAALLLNISGHLTATEIKRRVERSAFIDLDPGFTQFWQAQLLTEAMATIP